MTDKLKQLLHILSDSEFHSGETLGKKLGVTRSAVWKLIHQLSELQIEIESKTKLGYRVPNGYELLDAKKIKSFLPENLQDVLKRTVIFDSVSSTNTYLLNEIRSNNKKLSLCLAESQTAGRGRFQRPWISPFAKSIYLSLHWHFACDVSQLSGLSIAIAIAIVRTLAECGINDDGISIKWPNDILWHNQKLAGVLVEIHGESHHECDAVIGIGLNLNLPKCFIKKIDQAHTDLSKITDKAISRNEITALLIKNLFAVIQEFEKNKLKNFSKEWQKFDHTHDKAVVLHMGQQQIHGISRGIDHEGYLLLETENKKIQRYLSGEVSLRLK